MIYGYTRCSTNDQKQEIEQQIDLLLLRGVPQDNIYFEYQSGAKKDRIQLNRLLDALKEGDTSLLLRSVELQEAPSSYVK